MVAFIKHLNLKIAVMKKMTYNELISFCARLPFHQLLAFREQYKTDKNKEFMVACVVLRIRTSRKKYAA